MLQNIFNVTFRFWVAILILALHSKALREVLHAPAHYAGAYNKRWKKFYKICRRSSKETVAELNSTEQIQLQQPGLQNFSTL